MEKPIDEEIRRRRKGVKPPRVIIVNMLDEIKLKPGEIVRNFKEVNGKFEVTISGPV